VFSHYGNADARRSRRKMCVRELALLCTRLIAVAALRDNKSCFIIESSLSKLCFNYPSWRRIGACSRNAMYKFISLALIRCTQQYCSLAPLLILFAAARGEPGDSLSRLSTGNGKAFVRAARSIDSIKSCSDC